MTATMTVPTFSGATSVRLACSCSTITMERSGTTAASTGIRAFAAPAPSAPLASTRPPPGSLTSAWARRAPRAASVQLHSRRRRRAMTAQSASTRARMVPPCARRVPRVSGKIALRLWRASADLCALLERFGAPAQRATAVRPALLATLLTSAAQPAGLAPAENGSPHRLPRRATQALLVLRATSTRQQR